jgi:hypothetical protein
MNRFLARVAARLPLVALGGLATVASAAPVALDTEQKAAAAAITASTVAHNTPIYHWQLIERAVFYTNRALQAASSVTTPAALMAAPAGIAVPCPVSGNMTARMAPRLPRVFKFEWHDCAFVLDGTAATLNGPGEVLLLSDDFAPAKVAGIRFGSADRDFIQTQEFNFPWLLMHKRFLRNLRLAGIIPLTISPYAIADSSSPFIYVATGFVDENDITEFPGTEQPPAEFGQRLDYEFVTFTGNYSYNADATQYDEDVGALFGKVTYTRREAPPYGVTADVSRFDGFRVHNHTDFNTMTKTQTIDGKLDYTWNPLFGPGCLNGGYQFRTRTPLHGPAFAFPEFDAGDLTINGTARTTFYSATSAPSGLPVPTHGMLIHTDVQGVGSFNYDTDSLVNGLRSTAHCM